MRRFNASYHEPREGSPRRLKLTFAELKLRLFGMQANECRRMDDT